MLNQVVPEAIVSAKYVDHYLDAVENLPDEIQRFITRIRELDVKYRSCLRDVDYFYEQWANCPTSELEGNATKRNRAMTRIQQSLIAAQELGDEKLQIVQQLTDLIEGKTRQLDQDFKNLDYDKEEVKMETISIKDNRSVSPVNSSPSTPSFTLSIPATAALGTQPSSSSNGNASANNGGGERGTKRARRARNDTGSGIDVDNSDSNTKPEISIKQTQASVTQKKPSSSSGSTGNSNSNNNANSNNNKKKRKKSGRTSNSANNNGSGSRDDTPPIEEAIDPDEPTYCLCDQISFGEMILCDNDLCPIEWFHFSCVSLMTKPKGKWFCPNCRGDRPNVMKPKAQFLKELERYNKEKEEKT